MTSTQLIIMFVFGFGILMIIADLIIKEQKTITMEQAIAYPMIPVMVFEEYGIDVVAIIPGDTIVYVVDNIDSVVNCSMAGFKEVDNKTYLFHKALVRERIYDTPTELHEDL